MQVLGDLPVSDSWRCAGTLTQSYTWRELVTWEIAELERRALLCGSARRNNMGWGAFERERQPERLSAATASLAQDRKYFDAD